MTKALSEGNSVSTETKKTTIILADDHPLLRRALRSVLEEQSDFEVTAEASDGEETVELCKMLVPDVVIMDISMPTLNGLEATRQIKAKNPEIIVLVLTVHDDNQHILGILEAGANGYLTKNVFGEEVVHAIRSAISGETVLSPDIFQRILKHALQHSFKPIPVGLKEELNVRELEILRLAAKGMSNKNIALQLNLSLPTIKTYLSVVYAKLNASSRTEAVITALRAGIITINN